MFKRLDITLLSAPCCETVVDDLTDSDFYYYDKDGFELNLAEQKFYRAQGFPIDSGILNHCCWQEPWFTLDSNPQDLILDHSMFLCRCEYRGEALEQLQRLKTDFPLAGYLLNTRVKWGYDFALDAVRDDCVFEVLHVEYDHCNYESFKEHMINFDWHVRHIDWCDAADRVWRHQDQWRHLQGFEQNHWKAQFLLGWKLAEYTEKAVNI